MELVNSLISSIHVVSASLSILFGGWVLIKAKGTLRHKKNRLVLFCSDAREQQYRPNDL
ncbi:MAG: hypothetical protein ACKVHT_01695 [Flavobacteriales bacterium]|tara:strand:- start:1355 stop:1531 length:177 start_codon:yes stop_codon:yes gene_type:complete